MNKCTCEADAKDQFLCNFCVDRIVMESKMKRKVTLEGLAALLADIPKFLDQLEQDEKLNNIDKLKLKEMKNQLLSFSFEIGWQSIANRNKKFGNNNE